MLYNNSGDNMKKGFTLVELLAVIVILGIISMVTYSIVSGNIKTTKKKSFEVSVQNLMESSREYVTKYMEDYDFPEGGLSATDPNLGITNNPFVSGIILRNEKDQIELVNVNDETYCANGTKNDLKISEVNEDGICEGVTEDKTEAVLIIKKLKEKASSATIMIKVQDSESGISSYKICNGSDCTEYKKNNEVSLIKEAKVINNLLPNTRYMIKVEATNGKGIVTEQQVEINTIEIDEPQFSISSGTQATVKELTITYPENTGEYEYWYKRSIDEEAKKVDKQTTTFEINEKMIVKAYITRNGQEVAANEIVIDGIDVTAPTVEVTIPDINEWTKEKQVTIKAEDNLLGSGLALRPYTYDNGKEWIKENPRTINTSMDLYIKSRDRLGNASNKFILNGDTECYTDGTQPPCIIKKIDNLPPQINIEIISGEEIRGYYINDVKLKITITNYYLYNGEKIVGGIEFDLDTLKITKNGNKIEYKEITKTNNQLFYELTLVENTAIDDEVKVEIQDKLGNKGTGTKTVNIDRKVPDIIPMKNPLGLKSSEDKNLLENLSVTYGPLGGTTVCDPENNKPKGSTNYTTNCTATANNGLVATTSFNVKHEYAASSYTEPVCDGHYEGCTGPFAPDTAGEEWSCNCSATNQSERFHDPDHNGQCCHKKTVTRYYCPNGGTLKEKTCYY